LSALILPAFSKKPARNRSQQLLELACKAFAAERGGIGILSADNEVIEHLTFGLGPQQATQIWRNSWTKDIVQFVLERGGRVNCANLSADHPALGKRDGFSAVGPFMAVSLLCPGRCNGALYFARSIGDSDFSSIDEDALLPLRDWLEEGKLLEETGVFRQLRLLNQVAQATAGSLDLDYIVSTTLRELDRHLPLHVCAIWLPAQTEQADTGEDRPPARTENSRMEIEDGMPLKLAPFDPVFTSQAAALGLSGGERLRLDQTPFKACLRDGAALYADLTRPEERIDPLSQRLASSGANSTFSVPLRWCDQTVGILQSICTRPSGFTNAQIQLLYLVADLLGPAISHCRDFERLRAAYEKLRDTQSQLIQAEKLRALGELASGMAHDFNNSLCGVLGFLEVSLVERDLTPALRHNLESARTCALDAAQTVRRVQDFARSQRNELSAQLIDLNELVRQTVQLTRHKWDRAASGNDKTITMELHPEATSPIYGSAGELREVLTNLIFNAVDAMPRGGRLTVRTWSQDRDTYLSVADTGIGMNQSVQQRLFEPFFTTKGERGNGLGLSVTFGIIRRYGGTISAESELGRGSTFIVRLPAIPKGAGVIAKPKASEVPEPTRDNSPTREQAASTTGLRILVIEDEEPIRRFLETALTRLGHQPKTTADARQGLAAFAAQPFDVVLTDLGLPGISGEEVARTIHCSSPQTPIVMLTGWSCQLNANGQKIEGVSRIIGKPVTLQTLAQTLATIRP
jgi:signal transduction histidine kinase